MMPKNVATGGYLNSPFSVTVEGYLGFDDIEDEDVLFGATFIVTFGDTFTDTFKDTFL